MCVGEWDGASTVAFGPDTVTTITLAAGASSRLDVFRVGDIHPSGTVTATQVLDAPSDLTGTVTLAFGSGPPDAIPVTVIDLDVSMASVQALGLTTGVTQFELIPGSPGAIGVYDSVAGHADFHGGIPVLATAPLFPLGVEGDLILVVEELGGTDQRLQILGHVPMPLRSSFHTISLTAGGAQTFELEAGALHGNELYLLLGSATGIFPGLPIGGGILPLNLDGYFSYTLGNPGLPPLSGSFGLLDGAGAGSAAFTLPPATSPVLAGATLNHAFVTLDPLDLTAGTISNPVPVLLVAGAPAGSLVINEVDYDQAGTDTEEFVEIYNKGGSAVELGDLVLDLWNGASTTKYDSYALSAAGASLPAGGYLVLGSPSVTSALPAGVLSITFPSPSDNVQNGAPDGMRLREGTIVLDSMTYEGVTPGLTEGAAGAPTDDPASPESLQRLPNGIDTGENGVDFSTSAPTPGLPNA